MGVNVGLGVDMGVWVDVGHTRVGVNGVNMAVRVGFKCECGGGLERGRPCEWV